MGAMDYANAVTKSVEQDTPSLVEDISGEVFRLQLAIDHAEQRLAGVLEPEYLTAEKAGDTPAPIRSRIRQTHSDLSNQINRLIAILDRVEA